MGVRRLSLSSGRELRLGERALVMGILNCTPDSFFDGGEHATVAAAVNAGLRMAEEGADIIDVGGESTRPGAQPVCVEEECRRVLPVIEGLCQAGAPPISIDTGKSEVAQRALKSGAELVNDVTALRGSGDMGGLLARSGAPVILMHMQRTPADMQKHPVYGDVVGEVKDFLLACARAAEEQGVPRDRILLDPGFGFGKTLEHNVALLVDVGELVATGYPVAVGLSRKSMIEHALGLPVHERLEASLALAVLAVERGVALVRVHDVAATVRAVRMAEAVLARSRAAAV